MFDIEFKGKSAVTGKWIYGYYVLENYDTNTIVTHEGERYLVTAGTVIQTRGGLK